MLTPQNRHVPQNLVVFSFKERGFMPVAKPGNVLQIFRNRGTSMRFESSEAKAQKAREDGEL
jgi:hypothetical protein